jgi:hypothetical protein
VTALWWALAAWPGGSLLLGLAVGQLLHRHGITFQDEHERHP